MEKDDIHILLTSGALVVSVFALLISASVGFYDINENEQTKIETINILTSRGSDDYLSKLIPVSFYQEQFAIMPVWFECIIVNEGEKPVNIIDYSIRDISNDIIDYTYMDMGISDSYGNKVSFPINLQSKESKKLFMRVGLRMNSTVFNNIEAEKLQSENTTIGDITYHCAEKGYDIYGNNVAYTEYVDGISSLKIDPKVYQVFSITFSTSNYNSFHDMFSWYKMPQ